jgi:hypothetical protein
MRLHRVAGSHRRVPWPPSPQTLFAIMKTLTRKKLGVAALVISPVVALAFYVSGTPLLSLVESHSSSFSNGVVIVSKYKMHWPLLPVCLLMLMGLIACLWPAQKPPRLAS